MAKDETPKPTAIASEHIAKSILLNLIFILPSIADDDQDHPSNSAG